MSKEKLKNSISEDEPKDIVEHLSELRFRLIAILTLLILSVFVMFYFSNYIYNFLTGPFFKYSGFETLNNIDLFGGFSIRLRSSVAASLLILFPFVILQIWSYIKPAIEKKDRWMIRINLFFGILFFYIGCAFAFFLVLPFSIEMLVKFTPEKIHNFITASSVLNFIFIMSATMGGIFELPVLINILTGVGILTPAFLSKKRKYAVVIIWITAAVITPADILSQIAVAVPLMFLYEIAILFSYVTYRGYKKKMHI